MTEIIKCEVMTSREIAELTGKEHSNVMRDIRSLLEQGVGQINFELSSYTNSQNKKQPMYQLTKKGCLILASGYNALLREKIINRWEELELKERQNAPTLPDFTNPAEAARAWAAEYEAKQQALLENERLQLENTEMKREVTHKENVIIGLVGDIDLATKRQRITQIVRKGADGNYRERYQLLYSEFEKKYHVDLSRRMNSCEEMKPKIKNKMDYIDRVMNMTPQLYEVTCKLFENDVEILKKEWDDTI